jgi:hypothetical protein
MKRPWDADPVLEDIITTVCTGSKSIVSLIHNSPEFRGWFAEQKRRLEVKVGARVNNFCLARHRYDSTVKPVSRAALNLIALVRTADQIVHLRKGASAEVSAAKAFLNWITTERAILLAMLADAGQEAPP